MVVGNIKCHYRTIKDRYLFRLTSLACQSISRMCIIKSCCCKYPETAATLGTLIGNDTILST